MFGFVRPYLADLSEEEKSRYRAVYCGLCRMLNEQYGLMGRIGLNYDMTFLTLLLGSLYEPEETAEEKYCVPHPVKKHWEIITPYTGYAAAMTVALAYYKALDDWEDEKKTSGKVYAGMLKKHYEAVRDQWPRQCRSIVENIEAIRKIEASADAQPEQAAECTGRMLDSIFAVKEDFFWDQMRRIGHSLGKFIYMLDAAVDYDRDQKKGCYNPLILMNLSPEDAGILLRQPLGQAAEAFEALPLMQDIHIMRNILYSGVWQDYNRMTQKKAGDADGE